MMKRTIAIFIIVLAAVPAPITPGQGRIDTGTNIGANQVRLALPEMQAKSNDPQLVKFTALFNQVLKDDLDYSGSIAIVRLALTLTANPSTNHLICCRAGPSASDR